MDHDIPHAEITRYERERIFFEISFTGSVCLGMLKYYQWSPLILLFMAVCFYFPRMIWRSLNNKSGLDIEKLVEAVMKQEQKDNPNDERAKAITSIYDQIRVYIENRYVSPAHYHNHPRKFPQKVWYYLTFWRHRHLSAYIVLLFTFVKFLFLMNSLMQIFLLNAFLGNEYHLFGFEVIAKFLRGLDWGESKRFPRVTLCDFHIREVGIVHRYTVQCVLPINLFNEKIFLILWFWILLLAAFNIGDFISWILRIINVNSRSEYVTRKLLMNAALLAPVDLDGDDADKKRKNLNDPLKIKRFTRDYLQEDGCFALRLLARNGQDIIVGEVIDKLYEHYYTKHDPDHTNTDQQKKFSNGVSQNPSHASTYRPAPRRQQSIEINANDDEQRLFMKTTS
jgi:hypothetical protein